MPLACSEEFRPRSSDELKPVLTKYSLKRQGYSLYVGTIEPRKNLNVLLDAYALLPLSIRQQWPLVLIGYKGWRSEQLHVRIKTAVKEGWAHYLGFVEADDLPFIYAGARVFVFPSLVSAPTPNSTGLVGSGTINFILFVGKLFSIIKVSFLG